jgi:Tol biopolymer transport system component
VKVKTVLTIAALTIFPSLHAADGVQAGKDTPVAPVSTPTASIDSTEVQPSSSMLRTQVETLAAQIDQLNELINNLTQELTSLKASQKAAEGKVEYYRKIIEQSAIIPSFIRPLVTEQEEINQYNPSWSPDAEYISFEQEVDQQREIVISTLEGEIIQTIPKVEQNADPLLAAESASSQKHYYSNLAWAPQGDRFVYMGSAGRGNFDLFLGYLGQPFQISLTSDTGTDGYAHWSKADNSVAFLSGRQGTANIFKLNLESKQITPVTQNKDSFTYPQWSPDGKAITAAYGDNSNHDIVVIDYSAADKKQKLITKLRSDELRPTWSPNGKLIAFYTNYSPDGKDDQWSIAVVPAKIATAVDEKALQSFIVARGVVPDVSKGPAWLPNSDNIAYVKSDPFRFNPIYVVNVTTRSDRLVMTNTKMNRDLACSSTGLLAFRSQVNQWDLIHVAHIPDGHV